MAMQRDGVRVLDLRPVVKERRLAQPFHHVHHHLVGIQVDL
jgi:hypothetical protein